VQAKYIQDFLSLFVWDDGIAVWTALDFRVGLWVSLGTLVMRVETRICLYLRCPLCLSDFNRKWIGSEISRKMPQYQFSLRSGVICLQTNGRADGWTDGRWYFNRRSSEMRSHPKLHHLHWVNCCQYVKNSFHTYYSAYNVGNTRSDGEWIVIDT
jgi:hypothetical protein